jgi:uroporphyrinogen III methyltransferase / synthase
MAQIEGKVYILGAGLGAVDFLTVAGQAILSTTEVLIYDALIDPKLLTLTPETCIHLWVGKRGQQPSTPQSEINQLLVTHCQQGKRVVRLKSGDPGIFGRIASEVQALRDANCRYEVWPGLSSAIAAPTLAGIPLTDPTLSRSVTIVSAHDTAALDGELMARSETLVVLMGGRSFPTLLQLLQDHGKSSHTPIAIIKWGGSPQQQVWVGTLETILNQTQGERLSPTVMVIGAVVQLRDTLAIPTVSAFMPYAPPIPMTEFPAPAQEPLPLTGLTILVTRSAGQAPVFRQRLEAQGAAVLEMAALEIGPPSSWDALDGAIAQIHTFDWLFLTSANGVDYFFERLFAQGKDARALAGVKIAVVGRKTATSLKARGLTPDFIPPNYIADALVEHFPDRAQLSQQRCLFPRVESGGREVLVQQLTAQGASVVEVPAYQSQCPTAIEPRILEALHQQSVDIITFASSKTVEFFWQLLHQSPDASSDWEKILRPTKLASIGPQTSKTCHTLLGRVDIEAQEYTLEGLIQSIVQTHI